jgi:hypothetical protein
LQGGAQFPVAPVLTLVGWAVVAVPAAARWFKWE